MRSPHLNLAVLGRHLTKRLQRIRQWATFNRSCVGEPLKPQPYAAN